jgi:hypothetical protein
MERGNTKHGVVQDEQMKNEVESTTQYADATGAQEWAEDQPDVAAGPSGGVPPGMAPEDVQLRSALAAHLGKEIYPARRDELLVRLHEENAPDRLIRLVAGLPAEEEFKNVQDIAVELGLHVENQRF